jgi:hypothetical protein
VTPLPRCTLAETVGGVTAHPDVPTLVAITSKVVITAFHHLGVEGQMTTVVDNNLVDSATKSLPFLVTWYQTKSTEVILVVNVVGVSRTTLTADGTPATLCHFHPPLCSGRW